MAKDVTKGCRPTRERAHGLACVPQGREILPHLTVREKFRCSASGRGRTSRTGRSKSPRSTRSISSFLSSRKSWIVRGCAQRRRAAAARDRSCDLVESKTPFARRADGRYSALHRRSDRRHDYRIQNQRRFAILLVEQGLHFAARLSEKYVVMAKGAVVVAGKSTELTAEMVKQYLTV